MFCHAKMESLLASEKTQQQRRGNDNDLRSSLCYYLSIILLLCTFIMSCVSMGLCSSVGILGWSDS